jgi:hypothetical protein
MYIESSPAFLRLNSLVIVSFQLPCAQALLDFRLEAVVVRLTLTGASLMFLAMDADIIRALSNALASPSTPIPPRVILPKSAVA